MNWKDYSSLKSGGKVSFAKEKQTTREAVDAVDEVRGDDGNTEVVRVMADGSNQLFTITGNKISLLGKPSSSS